MTSLDAWLGSRRPAPPSGVRDALDGALPDAGAPDRPVDRLSEAAHARREEARATPGRVRDSAFHLLLADALVTYASEAALEDDDVEATLARLVHRAAAP